MGILGIYASQISGHLSAPFDSLQTVTVGSGGAASIDFTAIPDGYKHLQIRGVGRSTAGGGADVTGRLQFNSDTAANYSTHRMYAYGSSVGADSAANASQISFASILADGNPGYFYSAVVCDILDYSSGDKYKTTRSLAGGDYNSGGMAFITSGNWRSTSAVTSITLFPSSGSWKEFSKFALYGVKG
jgi:hypothetical protein